MNEATPITVAYGDGIGPEIMEATLSILKEARANIRIETIEVGERAYIKENMAGIAPSAWNSLRSTKVLLKAPITTPQGGGYKSLNVTIRKTLDLYANVRPCVSYHPFVKTNHPDLNVVVIRENSEDLYEGIEHRQTENVYQCLKLISRQGCENIVRYAFEYAVQNNRKKVTCFSKDNIMKMTDGIFHKVFDEIAKEYPQIKNEHYIIDIGSARLANKPEIFDVIVTSNLYGDIISDIAAEISGSVGLAGSSNIGDEYAMFEAVHGSAPDISGQNIANPSGLLQAAVMMLVHIGQADVATTIQNAWLTTIEQGIHTPDIYNQMTSAKKVGTTEFAQAVISNLGSKPEKLPSVSFSTQVQHKKRAPKAANVNEPKQLVGVDVFFEWNAGDANALADKINKATDGRLNLQMITSRGLKLWPALGHEPAGNDHWRGRFVMKGEEKAAKHEDILQLLTMLHNAELEFIKSENLYIFGETLGFSLAQGE